MKRTITERMQEASDAMLARHSGRGLPRVFFLTAEDHAEFMATDPELMDYPTYVGGQPVTLELPRFETCAVRLTQARSALKSKLYSSIGSAKQLKDA